MKNVQKVKAPDHILSYFRLETVPLMIVTVSGILYNAGMVAGPYFEGQMAQCLYDIIKGKKTYQNMLILAASYLAVIFLVQIMRCFKRFYVRRFANDTSRNMRHMLYNNLVNMRYEELEKEKLGSIMTKAVGDVDACVEGMRKFTTEIFDTGVVLVAYLVMLFSYDWRLAALSVSFTLAAYLIAGRLKTVVTRFSADYRKSAGRLNQVTMDRIGNALTYRVYGCDVQKDRHYEAYLADYEKRAVRANLWESTMQPLYNIISMCGIILILFFGARNVLGTGWTVWNIAAFTTFMSCFVKMAGKSSRAAKLFNAVQKAQVSWKRIKPLMQEYVEKSTESKIDFTSGVSLTVRNLNVTWEDGQKVLSDIGFDVSPGQIIGITGPVACGKTTLARVLIGELAYEGSIKLGTMELSEMSDYEKSRMISYMGHQPELMSDTLEENVCLGEKKETAPYFRTVCLDEEIRKMPLREKTYAGSNGIRLSGGQQARCALARTLFHDAQILILDDPFSAVDQKTEQEIFDNLKKIAEGRTILLISHRLKLFPQMDKVLFIEKGHAAFASHEDLLRTNQIYAGLYGVQMNGGMEYAG